LRHLIQVQSCLDGKSSEDDRLLENFRVRFQVRLSFTFDLPRLPCIIPANFSVLAIGSSRLCCCVPLRWRACRRSDSCTVHQVSYSITASSKTGTRDGSLQDHP
jgi:hypothetical protein